MRVPITRTLPGDSPAGFLSKHFDSGFPQPQPVTIPELPELGERSPSEYHGECEESAIGDLTALIVAMLLEKLKEQQRPTGVNE
ncbi:MAG TPA: hypothetical protein V6D11_29600 [Waterburya sp.]|jgi:hypothetical protein